MVKESKVGFRSGSNELRDVLSGRCPARDLLTRMPLVQEATRPRFNPPHLSLRSSLSGALLIEVKSSVINAATSGGCFQNKSGCDSRASHFTCPSFVMSRFNGVIKKTSKDFDFDCFQGHILRKLSADIHNFF